MVGCREGRSIEAWVNFDLYGHRLVTHFAAKPAGAAAHYEVDADSVSVPHFGIVRPIP